MNEQNSRLFINVLRYDIDLLSNFQNEVILEFR